jgi:hypothetical protein
MAQQKTPIQKPGSQTWPFRLGDKVRDKINGLEGIAISRYFHVTGCDRFMIELPLKDGAPQDNYIGPAERLELVESFPDRHREEVPDMHIHLGDECKAVLSGVAGVCAMIHVPLHGATQVDISPKWDPKEKKLPEGYFVDAAFVEVTKPYTPAPRAAKKPTEAIKKERGASRMPKRSAF